MHTQSSQIYHTTRIPSHTMQCAATLRTLQYLGTHYPKSIVDRHRERAVDAMLRIEKSFH